MYYSDHDIRNWARNNGYQPGERGRLPANILDAFNRAHESICVECAQPTTSHRGWCSMYEAPVPVVATDIPVVVDDFPVEDAPKVAPVPSQAAEVIPTSADATFSALVAQIAASTVSALPAQVDETRVREIAQEEAINAISELVQPKTYEIHVDGLPAKSVETATHARFEDVVKIVGAGLHVYLVGPPGTGKTTLCSQVADALSLPFGMIPCDPTMPASKLFGFVDAGGNYRDTVFRRCYEDGGVFLFDELDNAHPGIIASINGAIANGHCAFPDGMVKRSANFRCAAAANTFGTGATRQFVGRNQLDAATLDRFVCVVVDIDEELETGLALANIPDNHALGNEWLVKVRGWRKAAADHNLQVIISPRASIEGARLLGIGFDMATVAEMKVWKGMDKGTRDKIERGY